MFPFTVDYVVRPFGTTASAVWTKTRKTIRVYRETLPCQELPSVSVVLQTRSACFETRKAMIHGSGARCSPSIHVYWINPSYSCAHGGISSPGAATRIVAPRQPPQPNFMYSTYDKIDHRFTYRETKNGEPAISTKPPCPPIMRTSFILPSSDSSIPATKAGRRQRQAGGAFSRAPPHRVPSMYKLLIYGGRREIAAVGRRANTQVAGTCAVTCVFYIRGLHVPPFAMQYALLYIGPNIPYATRGELYRYYSYFSSTGRGEIELLCS